MGKKELKGLAESLDAMSLGPALEEGAPNPMGSIALLSPVRASNKQRTRLGAEQVLLNGHVWICGFINHGIMTLLGLSFGI